LLIKYLTVSLGSDTRLIEEVKERENELRKNAEKILSYFLSL